MNDRSSVLHDCSSESADTCDGAAASLHSRALRDHRCLPCLRLPKQSACEWCHFRHAWKLTSPINCKPGDRQVLRLRVLAAMLATYLLPITSAGAIFSFGVHGIIRC